MTARKNRAGRKHTAAEVALRRESVEVAVRAGTLTRRKARELGERWGVKPRQIWRDRDAIVKAWAAGISSEDRAERCALLLEEVRALRAATASRGITRDDAGLVRCAVELLKLERDLLGLASPAEVVVNLGGEDPAALAAEVAAVLPFVAGVLGEEGRQVIEATFAEHPNPAREAGDEEP